MSRNLKRYRKELGLTQVELGVACGFGKASQSRVSNYESGVRTPSLQDAQAMVRVFCEKGLRVGVDELFPADESGECA